MRILVVDDHQLFLDGLRHTLRRLDADVDIIAVSSAEEALAALGPNQAFDLILLDLAMPRMDGHALLKGLAERNVWTPAIVISAEASAQTIAEALAGGALGFIPKSHTTAEMLAGIKSVLAGNVYLPADLARSVERVERRRHAGFESAEPVHAAGVTRRQFSVLELLAKGYANKTIATTLNLTEHTVESHVGALFQSLGVSNRTECVLEAKRRGLIPPGEQGDVPRSASGSPPS